MSEQINTREQYQRLVEEHETLSEDQLIRDTASTPLGTVSVPFNKNDDPEIKQLNSRLGYQDLILSNFPSRGLFYRNGMKISIRPATVEEIKAYSTMDENDPFDMDDKLNAILFACCKVSFSNGVGSYKDILEEDRFWVILNIKELTFQDSENKLIVKHKCTSCEESDEYEIKTPNLEFQDISDNEKYYDESLKSYRFQTKSLGEFIMQPPTIGVTRAVTDYIKEKEKSGAKYDKSFVQIFPYVRRDWRGLNSDLIYEEEVMSKSWSTKKFTLMYRLAETIKVGIKPEFQTMCKHCDKEVAVPVSFPNGIKSIFVVSDISDELL